MKRLAMLMLASGIPSLALAQDATGDLSTVQASSKGFFSGWEGQQEFSISPRVGKALPLDSGEDRVDESEGEVSLLARRENTLGVLPLQLKGGLTLSPQLFDDGDPESAFYGELTVGDSFIPFRQILLRPGVKGAGARATKVEDGWRPYFRYRFTSIYADLFDAWDRNEHRGTIGLRYRNIETIMSSGRMRPASEVGAASNVPGWSWELRGEVNRVWSTASSKRQWNPMVRGSLFSRPIAGFFRLYGEAQFELGLFRDEKDLEGDLRRDRRLRLTGGVDLSEWASKVGADVTFQLTGQYQRRWSNVADARHERGYFIPALSIITSF